MIYEQLPESDFITSTTVYTPEALEKLKTDIVGTPVKNSGKTIGKIIEAELKNGTLFVVCKMNDDSFYKTMLLSGVHEINSCT